MEFSAYLEAGLGAVAETLIRRYEGECAAGSVAEMEQTQDFRLGQKTANLWL